MMTPDERAKQFQPFDSLKGLREALAEREERHTRVQKQTVDDNTAAEINTLLSKLKNGNTVAVEMYRAFHRIKLNGKISHIDAERKFFVIKKEKIFFDDIYGLEIIDF